MAFKILACFDCSNAWSTDDHPMQEAEAGGGTHLLFQREEEAREYSRKRVLPMLAQESEHASAPASEEKVLEGRVAATEREGGGSLRRGGG